MAKEVMKFSDAHKKHTHTHTHTQLPLPSMGYMSQSRLDCGLIESRGSVWVFEVSETGEGGVWGWRVRGCVFIQTENQTVECHVCVSAPRALSRCVAACMCVCAEYVSLCVCVCVCVCVWCLITQISRVLIQPKWLVTLQASYHLVTLYIKVIMHYKGIHKTFHSTFHFIMHL